MRNAAQPSFTMRVCGVKIPQFFVLVGIVQHDKIWRGSCNSIVMLKEAQRSPACHNFYQKVTNERCGMKFCFCQLAGHQREQNLRRSTVWDLTVTMYDNISIYRIVVWVTVKLKEADVPWPYGTFSKWNNRSSNPPQHQSRWKNRPKTLLAQTFPSQSPSRLLQSIRSKLQTSSENKILSIKHVTCPKYLTRLSKLRYLNK